MRFGRDVEAGERPLDAESVADAIDAVVPTIEVVTGRFDNPMAAEPALLVADNGLAGYLILGDPVPLSEAPDLGQVNAVLRVNGDQVAAGDLASAGFDPWQMVAWLAGPLTRRQIGLHAGTVVSTGSLTGVHFARPGDGIVADLGPLGRLSVMITD